MDLERYLSQLASERGDGGEPATDTPGVETDWLHFCEFDLSSGHLQIGDASFIPSVDGQLFETLLPPGRYGLDVKVLDYGGDEQRISGLRVLKCNATAPLPGECIGETWIETAKLGVCDFKVYAAACGGDIDRAWAAYEPVQQQMDLHGMVVLDETSGALIPVVSPGFGDGTYPVFALDAPEGCVGVEIMFIPPDTPYPF